MQDHWLLDTIQDLEKFAVEHNLTGVVEGLGKVLAVYAAEATEISEEKAIIKLQPRK